MIFLTGGARSGKSALAVSAMEGWNAPVSYIATALDIDDEMRARIEMHRSTRPETWRVIEEPRGLLDAIESVDPEHGLVIDCLTLWLANLIEDHDDQTILDHSEKAADAAASRPGRTAVVTNEVGSGLVPMHPVGRRFRDLQGRINQTWASRAAQTFLVVAGRVLQLRAADDVGA